MATPLKWHGNEAKKLIEGEIGKRLDVCRFIVQNHANVLIGREGTGIGPSGKLIYGANPSKPGEPPRKQTGRLQGSVASEREGMVARVGTNTIYGRALELGTERVAARPWLRRALVEMTGTIRAILGRPIR